MCASTPTIAVSALLGVLLACGGTTSSLQTQETYAKRPLTLGRSKSTSITTRPHCERLSSLDEFASRLGESATRDPVVIKALAQQLGVRDTRLHLWTAPQRDDPGVSKWLYNLSQRTDAPLRCGSAASDALVVWIAVERAATLTVDSSWRIKAVLSPGFHDPVLVVLGHHATLHRQAVAESELRQGVRLPSELEPLGIVQLMATGKSGAYPVAEVWVDSDLEPSKLAGDVHLSIPERVDVLRETFRRGKLRHNRLLSKEAHAHATEVCKSGRAVHEVSTDLDPVARARRVRIEADAFGEAVARAQTLNSAFETLVQSPAHLLALTDPRFTDVGMASATDASRHLCLVVFLAAWPRIR